ncbi:NADH-quinone oxidoreductase subunit M [Planctomycetales bacterium ZRK34]|nr:NADH-quinone oxidoreductase subunit M [Planctomycetales bacterium ZRK34]
MILVALVGGLIILPFFTPSGRDSAAKGAALLVSSVVFLLSLCMAFQFDWSAGPTTDHPYQLTIAWDWIHRFGVSLGFGVDAVSVWLILLTTFLFPLAILGSFGDDLRGRAKEFYVWLLVLQAALIGVFAATDVILFYTFFELTLVPLFFLIGIYGSGNRRYAAMKFFVFTLAGSIFTFIAIVYVAWFNAQQTGVWTFYVPQLIEAARALADVSVVVPMGVLGWLPLVPAEIHTSAQHLVLAGLFCGFAVKVPLFPVHTWLPLAHTEAPTAGSVILAGVLLKLGSYGLFRFAVPMAPVAVVDWAPFVAVICIIGILYTALICWVQGDLKKLVAYSSVSHMGFCVLGLFALNMAGVGGSVMYMINHGLSTGALFLCVGMVYNRYHTRDMSQMGGFGRKLPVWSTFFVFFCLASVGLPGLNGFVGEFLTIFGAFTATNVLGIGYAAFAAFGLILGAIYILYMVGRVVMGPLNEPVHEHGDDDEEHHEIKDLNAREIACLVPLAIACLVLGLYPTPLLRSLEGTIEHVTAGTTAVVQARAETENTTVITTTDQPTMGPQRTLAEVSR